MFISTSVKSSEIFIFLTPRCQFFNGKRNTKQISNKCIMQLQILMFHLKFFGFVQSPHSVQLFVTPWTAVRQASLSLTISQRVPKFMSIESAMLTISSSASTFSFCLQSFPASGTFKKYTKVNADESERHDTNFA